MSDSNFLKQELWMRFELPCLAQPWGCGAVTEQDEQGARAALEFEGTLRALKLCPKSRSWEMAGEEISVYLEECLLCFSINSVLSFLRTFLPQALGMTNSAPLALQSQIFAHSTGALSPAPSKKN